jgi:hypothetical protein
MSNAPNWISAIALVLASFNGIMGRLHARSDDERFDRVRLEIARLKKSHKAALLQELAEEEE